MVYRLGRKKYNSLLQMTWSTEKIPKESTKSKQNKNLKLISNYNKFVGYRVHIKEPITGLPWWQICLPMKRTQVRSLLREDSACHGAAKTCEPHLLSPCAKGLCSAPREATTVKSPCTTVKNNPHSLQLGKVHAQQQTHTTKIKINPF